MLKISYSISPFGAFTLTLSATFLPKSARPIGDSFEIKPSVGRASFEPTTVYTNTSLFFFTLIFSKGYQGKGIAEGLRYGLYIGILMATPMAYASYAMYPIPYSLALQWFLYCTVQSILLGVLVALVYGKNNTSASPSM